MTGVWVMEREERLPATVLRWVAAALGAAVALLGGALAVWLLGERFHNLAGGHVRVSVPGILQVPQGEMDPSVVTAFGERVGLIVTQTPAQAVAFFWASAVVSLICYLVAALTCVVLCYRLARRTPFTVTMQWVTAGAGGLAVLGGVAVTVLDGWAKYLTVHSLPGVLSVDNTIAVGDLGYYIADSINLLFLVIGLTLLLLAAVLSRGARYYRDVKDLV